MVPEVRVYTEVQLERKIREERRRCRVLCEDQPSDEHCRVVRSRHLTLLAKTAKLSLLQRRVFILAANGASVRQIANALHTSEQRAYRLACDIRRKLRQAEGDRYYGLHEVYWREVRRYIYRKPRSLKCR